jgi:hypothetical protein
LFLSFSIFIRRLTHSLTHSITPSSLRFAIPSTFIASSLLSLNIHRTFCCDCLVCVVGVQSQSGW